MIILVKSSKVFNFRNICIEHKTTWRHAPAYSPTWPSRSQSYFGFLKFPYAPWPFMSRLCCWWVYFGQACLHLRQILPPPYRCCRRRYSYCLCSLPFLASAVVVLPYLQGLPTLSLESSARLPRATSQRGLYGFLCILRALQCGASFLQFLQAIL